MHLNLPGLVCICWTYISLVSLMDRVGSLVISSLYIYTYIYICVYLHIIYKYIYTLHIRIYIYIYIYMFICICIYIHIYIYIYKYIYIPGLSYAQLHLFLEGIFLRHLTLFTAYLLYDDMYESRLVIALHRLH
jgi:hypothetical protein